MIITISIYRTIKIMTSIIYLTRFALLGCYHYDIGIKRSILFIAIIFGRILSNKTL